MENELESKSIFNNIIEQISENRLKQLLEIISKNYPTKFKYKDINTELEYLKNHIIFKPYKKNIPLLITPSTVPPSTAPPSTTPPSTTPSLNRLPKENQCCARVWNDYIFEKDTMTKITNLPEIFKVTDFKNINIKKFNSKYIIGLQCRKKKYKDSSYCKLHINHLIHGDYNELPNKEICYHFMKDGKYL
jgi:hypothetical protein